jgi:hypothetical protein
MSSVWGDRYPQAERKLTGHAMHIIPRIEHMPCRRFKQIFFCSRRRRGGIIDRKIGASGGLRWVGELSLDVTADAKNRAVA